ncbi:hypothetical protein M6D81_28155 [Paenibacillus sp. J5C_2022]|uniref:hypothetical protein n=1 Tax=Paenibacillus sp. J5C2022 TaxID=2977129 RepID=UPI0021CEC622|nr:hypothetical protein [Paenibacillus sp. J5C2022]MCU6712578.1 hypothetical protein [Paenibacillus sp. J5C2022]
MRLFFYELKKHWTWPVLLIIGVLGILTWLAFLLPQVRDYNANYGNIYGDLQNEMFAQYGITLSVEELADFDIAGRRATLEADMDALIAAEPIFAQYGIRTFHDYRNTLAYDTDGMNEEQLLKYRADRAIMDNTIRDVRSQWLGLDRIEGYYVLFLERNIGMSRNGYSPVITRAENHYIHTDERNLTRYAIHDIFSYYAMVTGVYAIAAVILLTSPLVVTDRYRGMTAMQYSSSKGRSLLKLQGAACLFSATLLGLLLVAISFGLFFALTDAGQYWQAYIGAFDRGIVLYDILFSQYILILGAMVVALCVGTAGLAFVLSRYSSNLITLMLKLVPLGIAITWIAESSIHLALVSINTVFSVWFPANYEAPEIILCSAVMIIGMVLAFIVAARERRVDVR